MTRRSRGGSSTHGTRAGTGPSEIRLQRDWIVAEFAWENVARKLSGVYERVLAERPPVNARLARALRRRPGRRYPGR